MSRSFKSASGKYELLGKRAAGTAGHGRRFTDSGEAARFLRRMLGVGDLEPSLQSFAQDQGVATGKSMVDALADAVFRGELKIIHAKSPLTAPPGDDNGGDKPGDNDKPKPPPKPKPADDKKAELLVIVKDADGKPVKDAEVEAKGLGTKKTDKEGKADFGKVKDGSYDITAKKPGHAPKKNDPEGEDKKKAVSVPSGKKTTANLVQHPICANVSFFEGPTTRSKYFGFDHKTNIPAAANGEYWKPVPDHGALSLPGSKTTRDAARWVSVAVGQETELEINFDFKGPDCVPCIANSTFKILPASVAEVVTASVSAKKAVFKIKGKAKGEASLKVICDGNDIGWFHIWCETEKTLKLDVAGITTARAPTATYSLAALQTHFSDIYRQTLLKIDMKDLGEIDLTGDAALATVEANGYPSGGGQFLRKSGTPRPYDSKGAVLNALHAKASADLSARTTGTLPRAGAYRLYWYVPSTGCSILGTVLNIGSSISFGFQPDSSTARNSCAHEFGHSLNLRHPSDGASGPQFAAHNRSTRNSAVPAYTATNTEPASTAAGASGNVMANDPTNLMGYWGDRPNRKPLRYHQWKAAKRS